MTTWGPYEATVVEEHDGDTIRVDVLLSRSGKVGKPVDLGFNVWRTRRGTELKNQSVRFLGMNAPELATAAGKAALGYLQTLVKVGDVVKLRSRGWDKFGGRIDGTITLRDGRDVVREMIAAGFAVAWDGKGPKPA